MADNDEFDQIIAGVTFAPEAEETEDISSLSDREVIQRHTQVRRQLLELGEMLHPKTQAGRDLHSQRVALTVVMRARGLS